MQPHGDVRVFGRVRSCFLDVHLVKALLLGALTGDVLVGDGLQA